MLSGGTDRVEVVRFCDGLATFSDRKVRRSSLTYHAFSAAPRLIFLLGQNREVVQFVDLAPEAVDCAVFIPPPSSVARANTRMLKDEVGLRFLTARSGDGGGLLAALAGPRGQRLSTAPSPSSAGTAAAPQAISLAPPIPVAANLPDRKPSVPAPEAPAEHKVEHAAKSAGFASDWAQLDESTGIVFDPYPPDVLECSGGARTVTEVDFAVVTKTAPLPAQLAAQRPAQWRLLPGLPGYFRAFVSGMQQPPQTVPVPIGSPLCNRLLSVAHTLRVPVERVESVVMCVRPLAFHNFSTAATKNFTWPLHGCSAAAAESILRHGFDRVFNEPGQSAYGIATYLSSNWNVSARYAPHDERGAQTVILCQVALGEIGPPVISRSPSHVAPDGFDCVSDGMSVFAVFKNECIYPSFVLSLGDTAAKRRQ